MDYLYYHELYHYGIKGQKWGVRRYVNEDGTLTKEGQSRYNQLVRDNNDIGAFDKYVTDPSNEYYDFMDMHELDIEEPQNMKKARILRSKLEKAHSKYENEANKIELDYQTVQKK